ncbi:MAG TPA: alanine dehydrogenase [Geminicoccaceae bacterium]
MLVGVPKEIKNHEYRVGLTAGSVRELIEHGHQVVVETGAGVAIGQTDEMYHRAGAEIVETADEVFARAEMIVKVKEPQAEERVRLREGQILFTYLHLAPDPAQARDLVKSGCIAIAYETVTDARGQLPLLAPMSTVAGRMSIQAAAHSLETAQGGSGVLLSGVPGVPPGRVLVIGGGVVGTNAARIALGMGARVTILERSIRRINELDDLFGAALTTRYSTVEILDEELRRTDVVIGATLIPGAAAPKLVKRAQLKEMKPGSVIVDVAIDQGGCTETSRATTHADPTYTVDGVVHYCVANMPGGVANTSTFALNNATLPYVLALADKGYRQALLDDPHLRNGLNVHEGMITYEAVAVDLEMDYRPAEELLGTA